MKLLDYLEIVSKVILRHANLSTTQGISEGQRCGDGSVENLYADQKGI